jgi:cytochrome c-type biogenesis protein CcmE
MYFLTVPEIQHKLPTLQGGAVRVAGKVLDEPVQWDVRTLSLAFVMGEGGARLPVQYTGVKPDMFQAGADVIVEGYVRADGVLVASTLMTKCPSRYQDENSSTSSNT